MFYPVTKEFFSIGKVTKVAKVTQLTVRVDLLMMIELAYATRQLTVYARFCGKYCVAKSLLITLTN